MTTQTRLHPRLALLAGLGTGLLVAACGMGGSGVDSQQCKDYFAKVEECASKMDNDIKADAIRKTAEVSKENFEKNTFAPAVIESCKMMLEQLEKDPDCG